jgi:hypothetical protein
MCGQKVTVRSKDCHHCYEKHFLVACCADSPRAWASTVTDAINDWNEWKASVVNAGQYQI